MTTVSSPPACSVYKLDLSLINNQSIFGIQQLAFVCVCVFTCLTCEYIEDGTVKKKQGVRRVHSTTCAFTFVSQENGKSN